MSKSYQSTRWVVQYRKPPKKLRTLFCTMKTCKTKKAAIECASQIIEHSEGSLEVILERVVARYTTYDYFIPRSKA